VETLTPSQAAACRGRNERGSPLSCGPAQQTPAAGIPLTAGKSMRDGQGGGGTTSAPRRSWLPRLATEENLQGREGLRGDGCEAGGEFRDRFWVDLRRRFRGVWAGDVGSDVASWLNPGFPRQRAALFDPCRGYFFSTPPMTLRSMARLHGRVADCTRICIAAPKHACVRPREGVCAIATRDAVAGGSVVPRQAGGAAAVPHAWKNAGL